MPSLCIIPARALDDDEMTHQQLRALLAVGMHTSRDGTGVWASNRTLAEEARLDERHLRRALAELEARGYIRRVHRTAKNGASATSVMAIVLDEPFPAERRNACGEEGEITPGGRADSARGRRAEIARGRRAEIAHQTTPYNDPLERPSSSAPATPAKDSLPPHTHEAYNALAALGRNPAGFDASLHALMNGMHGSYRPEQVGQALFDLWSNGGEWNAALFRRYLQRMQREEEEARSAPTKAEIRRGGTYSEAEWERVREWAKQEDERIAREEALKAAHHNGGMRQ